ncbi:MAG: LrgB family protein [Sulfurovum sp.]|nr:LrgB family protein [Sulfurovum sp.]
MLHSPLFGLLLTFVVAVFTLYIKNRVKFKLFNPMLFATLLIVFLLLSFNIPYTDYKVGADYILKMLGPITVVLAVPLYQYRGLLKKHALLIIGNIIIGALTALLSITVFSHIAGLDSLLLKSLLAHSVTTPIGIETVELLEGLTGLTMLAIVITGISGALMADFVFKLFNITHPMAKGLSLGTSAHAIGTGRALEYGPLEGAIAGLSLSLMGLSTILWVLFFQYLGLV